MNDLISNSTEEQIIMLKEKYSELLKTVDQSLDMAKCAFIIDTCIDIVNKFHNDLPKVNKAWAFTAVMRKYNEINTIDTMAEAVVTIHSIIDSYITFNNKYYGEYCEQISLWNNDYAKDNQFISNFCLFN